MKKVIAGFKNIWESVSIIGITHDLPIELQKNITLANRFAFAWIFLVIPYFIIFLFFFPLGSALLAGLILSHVCTILFNRIKWYHLSRTLASYCSSVIIFVLATFLLNSQYIHTYIGFYILIFAFATFPFLFFSLKEFPYLLIGLALSLFYLISFEYFNEKLRIEVIPKLLDSKAFEILNYLVGLFLIFLSFFFLKKINLNYQDRIMYLLKLTQNYNERLKSQKKELATQKDKISQHNEKVINQRDLILKQTNEISSSMLYARRIQNAVLPNEQEIKDVFDDVFIYYVPKEIVSGDFYWFQTIGDFHYIAAADCTGHGVPGGFLSMLGTSFLNEIMGSYDIYIRPDEILNQLRDMVIKAFHQTGQVGETRDGMDIALCQIEKGSKKLYFAGANNPLYLIRKGELIEYKGDRMPIAFLDDSSPKFTLHEIDIQEGDIFYIFTDGYVDQFGGPNGKKFRYQNFKTLLVENSDKVLKQQKLSIDDTHREWSRKFDQIDDMLIIGFKV